ncbi:MAG: hypothetical protein GKR90_12920 [Pseudomonadales bacterium]|nr:hypothetical protein [Pseudomonadales bacterium]
MVQFLDPRGEIATAEEIYNLTQDIRADEGAGMTVGLLANGFPDSEKFLSKLGTVLESRLPKVKTKLWNKGNAGIAAGEKMLNEIKAHCQVAIAAYGH